MRTWPHLWGSSRSTLTTLGTGRGPGCCTWPLTAPASGHSFPRPARPSQSPRCPGQRLCPAVPPTAPPPPLCPAWPPPLPFSPPGPPTGPGAGRAWAGLQARRWPLAPAPPRVSTWHVARAEGTHKFCLSDEGRFERRPRRSCVLAPWPLPPWTRPRASGGAVRPPSRAAAGQLLVSHGPFLEGAPSGRQAQAVSPPSSSSERVRRGQPGRRACPSGEEAGCADTGEGGAIGPRGSQVLQPHWPDRTGVDAF